MKMLGESRAANFAYTRPSNRVITKICERVGG